MTEPKLYRPKPYTTRVSAGSCEIRDGAIEVPAAGILYPGERSDLEVEFNPDTGEARYFVTITPAPGFRMRMLRLRYRLTRGRFPRGKPHLTVDVGPFEPSGVADPVVAHPPTRFTGPASTWSSSNTPTPPRRSSPRTSSRSSPCSTASYATPTSPS